MWMTIYTEGMFVKFDRKPKMVNTENGIEFAGVGRDEFGVEYEVTWEVFADKETDWDSPKTIWPITGENGEIGLGL